MSSPYHPTLSPLVLSNLLPLYFLRFLDTDTIYFKCPSPLSTLNAVSFPLLMRSGLDWHANSTSILFYFRSHSTLASVIRSFSPGFLPLRLRAFHRCLFLSRFCVLLTWTFPATLLSAFPPMIRAFALNDLGCLPLPLSVAEPLSFLELTRYKVCTTRNKFRRYYMIGFPIATCCMVVI